MYHDTASNNITSIQMTPQTTISKMTPLVLPPLPLRNSTPHYIPNASFSKCNQNLLGQDLSVKSYYSNRCDTSFSLL